MKLFFFKSRTVEGVMILRRITELLKCQDYGHKYAFKTDCCVRVYLLKKKPSLYIQSIQTELFLK